MSRTPGSGLKHAGFAAIAVVGLPALALCLVEGASSAILFARDVSRALQAAPEERRRRVQYDSLLGWAWQPSIEVRDVWGPGIHFRTNARGFRGNAETAPRSPDGRVRILCSGDSFTEGAGVGNDYTWCALLESMNPRFESINLGQGGYGFDQAYLRFKRDGRPLEHAVHILAFITDDFRRMGLRQSWFWGKPTLALRNGVLTTENVPVPRVVPRFPGLRFVLDATQELRGFQLLGKLRAKLGGETLDWTVRDSALAEVVSAVVADLGAMSRADGTSLVLVYLPTLEDYLHDSADRWRQRLRTAAGGDTDVLYLDLIPELRRLPPDSAAAMFIPRAGGTAVRGADGNGEGHYTIRGNRWVADHLFQYLADLAAGEVPP